MSPAARIAAAVLLLAVATLPVLSRQYFGGAARDLTIYMHGVEGLLQGRLYTDAAFEYPPYALVWFLPPYFWSHDLQSFRFAFGHGDLAVRRGHQGGAALARHSRTAGLP